MTTIKYFGSVTAVIDENRKVIELRTAPPGRQPLPDGTKKRALVWARGRLRKEYPGYAILEEAKAGAG